MILVWNKDWYVIHVSLKYAEKRDRRNIFNGISRKGQFYIKYTIRCYFFPHHDFINAPIIFLIKHFVSLSGQFNFSR